MTSYMGTRALRMSPPPDGLANVEGCAAWHEALSCIVCTLVVLGGHLHLMGAQAEACLPEVIHKEVAAPVRVLPWLEGHWGV